MGYKIIQKTFDKRGVKYMKYTIIQTSKVFEARFGKDWKGGSHKDGQGSMYIIAKLDIEAMYLPFHYLQISGRSSTPLHQRVFRKKNETRGRFGDA